MLSCKSTFRKPDSTLQTCNETRSRFHKECTGSFFPRRNVIGMPVRNRSPEGSGNELK